MNKSFQYNLPMVTVLRTIKHAALPFHQAALKFHIAETF